MRALKIAVIGCAIALGVAGVGVAAQGRQGSRNAPAAVTPHALGGAEGEARLAIWVDAGGGVFRSKGVSSISHPAIGRYCITPTDPSVLSNGVGVVSVDWDDSSGNGLYAFWGGAGFQCPAGTTSVRTFLLRSGGGGGGGPQVNPSDNVAFTLVIE